MQLQRGVTGMYIQGCEDVSSVVPTSDLKVFRSHCYDVARHVGADFRYILNPRRACSYSMACFSFSDSTVVALLNVVYPIIGFVRPPKEGQIVFDYIDCPKLADAFRAIGGYTVVQSEVLDLPLRHEYCSDLAPSELKRVQYFRPARIGDVIFNYWD